MMLPFAGGMTSTLNGTLVFSVAAAVLYLFMTHRPVSLARTAAKTAAVALLAVLAWLAGGPVLLVAVLAVSALGDYFLSLDGERNFLFGLGSFLLGHIGYVVLFLPIGREAALPLGMAGTAVMLAAVVVFAFAVARKVLPRLEPGMKVPVIVYILAILAMGVTATAFNPLLIVIGAVLFMISDATIALEKFILGGADEARRVTGPAIWITYYLAQLALTFGVLALPR